MLIYVEGFAVNKSDERVGNVCLSVLDFSSFKHCQTILGLSQKRSLYEKSQDKSINPAK